MRHTARNHDEVVQWWARQDRAHGKGKRMVFEGATIYSHGSHWPLGTLSDGVAWINIRPYSTSTGAHRRKAYWAAVNAGHRVIEVNCASSAPVTEKFSALATDMWRTACAYTHARLEWSRDHYRKRVEQLMSDLLFTAGLLDDKPIRLIARWLSGVGATTNREKKALTMIRMRLFTEPGGWEALGIE